MKPTVCIQGLGFVGSAMAAAVSMAEDADGESIYDVVGVDLPNETGLKRIEAINQGRFPFEASDPTLEMTVARAQARGNLRAVCDAMVFADADIILVDVQLDIPFRDDEPQLQLDDFVEAVRSIGCVMREETLVIVETTVPPGTCEKIVVPVLGEELERRNLDSTRLRVAHSYERVMPGRKYLDSIVNFWRVYAGHTKEAADACEAFLSHIINVRDYPLTRLSSMTACETAKVLENTYRAVNISLISEWTRYAERVGIDLFEVVDAIRKRPTHSNIRFPGLGIGGYCLTKDPTFAPAAARQLFYEDLGFPFSKLAVEVASEMPHHAVERLVSLTGGTLEGKRILICGVSYREDVADTRYSPSEAVYRELREQRAKVDFHDPFVSWWDEVDRPALMSLPESVEYHAVVFAVPHTEYKQLDLSVWIANKTKTVVLDTFMVFDKSKREAFRQSGVQIEAIGVADGL